jgi:hypothetical protein
LSFESGRERITVPSSAQDEIAEATAIGRLTELRLMLMHSGSATGATRFTRPAWLAEQDREESGFSLGQQFSPAPSVDRLWIRWNTWNIEFVRVQRTNPAPQAGGTIRNSAKTLSIIGCDFCQTFHSSEVPTVTTGFICFFTAVRLKVEQNQLVGVFGEIGI